MGDGAHEASFSLASCCSNSRCVFFPQNQILLAVNSMQKKKHTSVIGQKEGVSQPGWGEKRNKSRCQKFQNQEAFPRLEASICKHPKQLQMPCWDALEQE